MYQLYASTVDGDIYVTSIAALLGILICSLLLFIYIMCCILHLLLLVINVIKMVVIFATHLVAFFFFFYYTWMYVDLCKTDLICLAMYIRVMFNYSVRHHIIIQAV